MLQLSRLRAVGAWSHHTIAGGCAVPGRHPDGRAIPMGAPSRRSSDFAYVRAGRAPPLRHDPVWDDAQRAEVWRSSTLPRVSLDPSVALEADEARAVSRHALATRLRAEHPDVWLVHLFKAQLEEDLGEALPLRADDLAALLAEPTPAERAAVSTELGRVNAIAATRAGVEASVAAMAAMEEDGLDGGLGGDIPDVIIETPESNAPASLGPGSLPISHRARASAGLHLAASSGALLAALTSARAICIANVARLAALGSGEERAREEDKWLASLGLDKRSTFRSPVVPSDAWETWDAPLTSPMTSGEAADEGFAVTSGELRAMSMEHRDRAEFLSRTRLPPPLHAGAPSRALAEAARALEDNPSLSPADREYMMSYYTDAFTGVDAAEDEDTSVPGSDFAAERIAWKDTQPQWGSYDPDLVRMQDDAADALAGRGKFSTYRGSTWTGGLIDPERYGLQPQPHVAAGTPNTPLETVEEVALSVRAMDARLSAEAALASAAIAAALERSMGLRGAASAGSPAAAGSDKASFFARYASGERPAKPLPPTGGHRSIEERVEMEKRDGKANSKGKGKK